jgi:mxaJ protein
MFFTFSFFSLLAAAAGDLRVCADPNNMPFSNERQQGFENAIANIIGDELGMRVTYAWFPQRRGFIRNTLAAGRCDLVVGIPARFDPVQTTSPYYRSTYVFVSRRDRALDITSLDDPRLTSLRIGVHVVGDDYASLPPVTALAHRGIINNIVGYSIYGDYAKEAPPADLIEGVRHGDVDVAIAWGPLAGYAARQHPDELALTALPASADPNLPFTFDIAMGVRRGDTALANLVEKAIAKRRAAIEGVLRDYGVPEVQRAP